MTVVLLWLLVFCGCAKAATPTSANKSNSTATHVWTNATTTATTTATAIQNTSNNNNNNMLNGPNHFKYPCAFIDTVNISGNYGLYDALPAHGVYVHDGLRIPPDLVAIYDFVIVNGVREAAARHLRACICRVKPCVRYCCGAGQYYDLANRTCSTLTVRAEAAVGAWDTMQVWRANGSGPVALNTSAHFVVHVGAPCVKMRLNPNDDNQLVQWQLFENGSISYEHHLFSKHYCYTPFRTPDTSNNNYGSVGAGQWVWQPLACAIEKFPFVLGVTEWTYAICLIIAVICMFITLFAHLACNELRNTFYGVAIKAYTICIIIGYSLMAHVTLTNPAHIAPVRCSNIACCILLFILLSFLLLCFISFNFYLNYHGITLTKPMFWLIFCPIVLLAVGWALFARFDRFGGKPVFGHEICWFDPRNFSILAYFYAPILIACLVCIFFYAVTLLHISERSASELNKLTTDISENRFKSFWSFFCYTLATWLVCLASFAIHNYLGQPTHVNYLVCLFIALHGFGALYTLVGKNRQIQNFLQRIDSDDSEYRHDANNNGGDGDDDDEERAAAAAVLGAHLYEEAMEDELDIDELSAAMRHVPITHF